jgi:acetyl esterase/lipase
MTAKYVWNATLVVVLGLGAAVSQALAQGPQQAQPREVEIRRDLKYATHDGSALAGDYYVPKAPGKYPVVVAVHGGSWQAGTRTGYRSWGSYLAEHGIALYAIDYRLSKPDHPSYPQAVQDVRAAIQFVKYQAAELKADPERVGLIGDSAGAHLAALVGIAGDAVPATWASPSDPYATLSTRVKTVVAFYGIYDMAQQWTHDQIARPRDQIVEKFLGQAPMDDRRIYFDASPISYATRGNNKTSFFLTWGTADDIADPATQSEAFLLALKQAEFFVRSAPVVGAPHFWMADPFDDPRGHVGFVAPQILRFLAGRL